MIREFNYYKLNYINTVKIIYCRIIIIDLYINMMKALKNISSKKGWTE